MPTVSPTADALDLCVLLGARIRSLRVEARMSQRELSDAVGCSRTTIVQIEAGQQSPSLATLAGIGRALGVDGAYFFTRAPSRQRTVLTALDVRKIVREELERSLRREGL